MMWLADGEKVKDIVFVSTEFTNMMDGQTPLDGIGRAYA